MSASEWYRSASHDEPLTQGDVVFQCPIATWNEDVEGLAAETLFQHRIEIITGDLIVMTQACDLVPDQDPVDQVVMCPVIPLSRYKATWEESERRDNQNPTSKSWRRHCEKIEQGAMPSRCMISSSKTFDRLSEIQVVMFVEMFVMPRKVVAAYLKERSQPRPQLLTPYREFVSHRLGVHFSRIGLPPLPKTW